MSGGCRCETSSGDLSYFAFGFFFFFSSRRRHTRLQGDWSSDVCSSDLAHDQDADVGGGLLLDRLALRPEDAAVDRQQVASFHALLARRGAHEERPAGAKIGRASCRERV